MRLKKHKDNKVTSLVTWHNEKLNKRHSHPWWRLVRINSVSYYYFSFRLYVCECVCRCYFIFSNIYFTFIILSDNIFRKLHKKEIQNARTMLNTFTCVLYFLIIYDVVVLAVIYYIIHKHTYTHSYTTKNSNNNNNRHFSIARVLFVGYPLTLMNSYK